MVLDRWRVVLVSINNPNTIVGIHTCGISETLALYSAFKKLPMSMTDLFIVETIEKLPQNS